MNRLYMVTGAAGHLGSTILRALAKEGKNIAALIMKNEKPPIIDDNIQYFTGDITDPSSLEDMFLLQYDEKYLFHCAGIVDISEDNPELLYKVNVEGVRNIIELSFKYHIDRFLYVSSVHAIPEKKKSLPIMELSSFSPESVEGSYAKTKAEASQLVLDAVAKGLPAIIIHPSGIIGPYDNSSNHLVQLIGDFIVGKLPASVTGSYDFVDVRDVAKGAISAIERGVIGECYILSNQEYQVKDILKYASDYTKLKKIPNLPIWIAVLVLPFVRIYSKLNKIRPLYTKYSLSTLKSNSNFSHKKASVRLGYNTRPMTDTIKDTIEWLKHHKFKK